ncbi:MAG: HNH endonuclease [Caulobacteraceae bacterium]|nr:HNH endonuclease [Caulobacteraceae bacterium]
MAWGNTSRHQRGYGSRWEKTRSTVLTRDMGLCVPCGKAGMATVATEVDHIKSKAQGGGDELDNLQSICRACHAAKTKAEADAARQARPGAKRRVTYGPDGWPIWND